MAIFPGNLLLTRTSAVAAQPAARNLSRRCPPSGGGRAPTSQRRRARRRRRRRGSAGLGVGRPVGCGGPLEQRRWRLGGRRRRRGRGSASRGGGQRLRRESGPCPTPAGMTRARKVAPARRPGLGHGGPLAAPRTRDVDWRLFKVGDARALLCTAAAVSPRDCGGIPA